MQPIPVVEHTAPPLSLRRNFSWTFAGNVVYAASQWGVLVVIARLGTPEMVGQFALALAITAPVIMFANLQLRAVQATDAKRAYAFADYLGLRLLTTAAALALIAAIALLSGYRAETALVILFVGFAKSCEALSDIVFGLLQQRERMDRIAKSLMIEGPATLAAMAAVLVLTGSIAAAAAAMALVWLLQLLLYDARSAAHILRAWPRPRWHWPTLRRLAWLALPLGLEATFKSLYVYLPRLFIAQYYGEVELGFFTALGYILVAGSIVVYAVGQASVPRLSQYFVADVSSFVRFLKKLIMISAVISIAFVFGSIALGREFLSIIYQPEYAQYVDVFIVLMIGAAISYISAPIWYSIVATHHFRGQLGISLLGLLTTLVGSLVLIPHMGLIGAAWISVANSLVLLVCFSVLVFLLVAKQRVKTDAAQ